MRFLVAAVIQRLVEAFIDALLYPGNVQLTPVPLYTGLDCAYKSNS